MNYMYKVFGDLILVAWNGKCPVPLKDSWEVCDRAINYCLEYYYTDVSEYSYGYFAAYSPELLASLSKNHILLV